MRDVLATLIEWRDAGRQAALCTLVEARGSTPQGPGASILVEPSGTCLGTIGGGCIEADVRSSALREMGGEPRVASFNLDNDYGWDDGLLCGGQVKVLIDPAAGTGENMALLRSARDALRANRRVTLATVYETHDDLDRIAQRFLIDEQAGTVHGGASAELRRSLIENCAETLASQGDPVPRSFHTLGKREGAGLLLQPLHPLAELLIVGGGHIAGALAPLALSVGFSVTVLDDREDFASPERFPPPLQPVCAPIGSYLGEIEFGPNSYVVVVTRGHKGDLEALFRILGRPGPGGPTPERRARYVGMIGSRRKSRVILENLRAEGVDEDGLRRIYTPIGVDIGSITPNEIALSIAAELVAVRRGICAPRHRGGSLLGRSGLPSPSSSQESS